MKTLYEIVDGKLVATQASEKQRSPFDVVIEEYSGWREYTRLAEESATMRMQSLLTKNSGICFFACRKLS